MAKYYTVLNLENQKFVGTVYDNSNNREVFRTKPHTTQSQVTHEINNFLTGITTTEQESTITNTVQPISVPTATPRRCCGR